MDEIDVKILNILGSNGRMAASRVSKQVNLSVPAVAERIRKMEQSGIIEKYTAKINRSRLGYELLAFITVNIDNTKNIQGFRQRITACPNVLECHYLAGQTDYMLKVLVKNTAQLEDFLMNTLEKTEGVASSNTLICLSTLKEKVNIEGEI